MKGTFLPNDLPVSEEANKYWKDESILQVCITLKLIVLEVQCDKASKFSSLHQQEDHPLMAHLFQNE